MNPDFSDETDDEKQPFVSPLPQDRATPSKSDRWERRAKFFAVLNILSCLLFTALSARSYLPRVFGIKNPELRKSQYYSPAYDWVDLDLRPVEVNGTLYPDDSRERPFARQMPNERADEVWYEWAKPRFFPVSGEDLRRMGKDAETAVRLEDRHWGLGDDKYAAIFDVNHQLHCVDTLRKIAYGTYYNRTQLDPFNEGMKEIHANHCIDNLVQTIQCNGNLNFITMHWYESKPFPKPMPDMSIRKQCINFDAFMQWRHDTHLSPETYKRVFGHAESLPRDLKAREPMETDYLRIHGHIANTTMW